MGSGAICMDDDLSFGPYAAPSLKCHPDSLYFMHIDVSAIAVIDDSGKGMLLWNLWGGADPVSGISFEIKVSDTL